MQISARNQIKVTITEIEGVLEGISAKNKISGTIKSIETGAVNSEVLLETGSKDIITAIITNDAIKELGLQSGEKAVAIIKANEIMIAK